MIINLEDDDCLDSFTDYNDFVNYFIMQYDYYKIIIPSDIVDIIIGYIENYVSLIFDIKNNEKKSGDSKILNIKNEFFDIQMILQKNKPSAYHYYILKKNKENDIEIHINFYLPMFLILYNTNEDDPKPHPIYFILNYRDINTIITEVYNYLDAKNISVMTINKKVEYNRFKYILLNHARKCVYDINEYSNLADPKVLKSIHAQTSKNSDDSLINISHKYQGVTIINKYELQKIYNYLLQLRMIINHIYYQT
jgi:hypothetical protein